MRLLNTCNPLIKLLDIVVEYLILDVIVFLDIARLFLLLGCLRRLRHLA